MPFRHPDRSHDLQTRIEFEVRERLEEAIDFVCLEALVAARAARGQAPPVADNADDRREFTGHVRAFLELLRAELGGEPGGAGAGAAARGDEQARLVAVQTRLARERPDYWQRFDAISARYLAGPVPSGGERRSLLARLFGRG